MIQNKILNFIFSYLAVYGEPELIHLKNIYQSCKSYGQTKAFVEGILKDYDSAYGLKSICLRYFNACGAQLDGSIGEQHNPEAFNPSYSSGCFWKTQNIDIYGEDYPTTDGTA